MEVSTTGQRFEVGPRWSVVAREALAWALIAAMVPAAWVFAVTTGRQEYSSNEVWWITAWGAGLTALGVLSWLSRRVVLEVVLGADHVSFRHRLGRTTTVSKREIREAYASPVKPMPSAINFIIEDRKVPVRGLLYQQREHVLAAIERDDRLWLTQERTVTTFDAVKRGGRKRFERYLSDQSTIAVADIAEMERWLREETSYRPDGRRDIWYSPTEFERHLEGDCDDHAVWAWTKLHRLGYEPEFVVGQAIQGDGGWGNHAWVRFYDKGELMNVEATMKVGDMIVPWSQVEHRYEVGAGVSAALHCFKYPVSIRYPRRRFRGR